jgi:hypothetical protein
MMVAELCTLAVLIARDNHRAVVELGLAGASNVPGYLLEHGVRTRFPPSGWDQMESPLAVVELALSAAMAALAAPEMRLCSALGSPQVA